MTYDEQLGNIAAKSVARYGPGFRATRSECAPLSTGLGLFDLTVDDAGGRHRR